MWIAIEGVDGVGKSTIANELESHFLRHGKKVLVTRNPGGWSKGAEFRNVILETGDWKVSSESKFQGWNPLARRLLLGADFVQSYEECVWPTLRMGGVVISDRIGCISGYAYGVADGVDEMVVSQILALSSPERKPDFTFLLHAPQDELDERLRNRGDLNFYDEKPPEYKKILSKLYDKVGTKFGAHRVLSGAGNTVEVVVNEILSIIYTGNSNPSESVSKTLKSAIFHCDSCFKMTDKELAEYIEEGLKKPPFAGDILAVGPNPVRCPVCAVRFRGENDGD